MSESLNSPRCPIPEYCGVDDQFENPIIYLFSDTWLLDYFIPEVVTYMRRVEGAEESERQQSLPRPAYSRPKMSREGQEKDSGLSHLPSISSMSWKVHTPNQFSIQPRQPNV